MQTLSTLPTHARIRLTAIAPAMAIDQQALLLGAIDKLFLQFVREHRISLYAAEILGAGQVLAVAWVDESGPLSGCSHDKLGQVLKLFEERTRSLLLAAPPIVIESTTGLRCVNRSELKTLLTEQAITPDSIHWDLRVDTLAAWHKNGRRPARETWLAPIIERAFINTR